jgi:LysM repeat protein
MRRALVALLALMALSVLPSGAANITVRAGDTLSDIAERYGVSIGSLMRVNGLRDSNHVEAGQTLRLPEGAAAGVTAGKGRHTVRSGDTLGAIALQYRVSERQLMVLNGLASADHVEKGQTLKLPSNAVLPKPKTAAKPKLKPVPVKADPNATSHTVARGQTLTQIAKAYKVPVASLVSINSIANPNQVNVGTKLMLRASETQPAAAVATRDQPETAAVPETTVQPKPKPNPKASAVEIKTNTTIKPKTRTATKSKTATKAKPVITAKADVSKTSPDIKPNKADWKTYGPLQVDWGNWQLMGGSDVAPTLNSDGQSLYVAVNCAAGKINVTSANGSWKTWSAPQKEFERDLLKDRCKTAKG